MEKVADVVCQTRWDAFAGGGSKLWRQAVATQLPRYQIPGDVECHNNKQIVFWRNKFYLLRVLFLLFVA